MNAIQIKIVSIFTSYTLKLIRETTLNVVLCIILILLGLENQTYCLNTPQLINVCHSKCVTSYNLLISFRDSHIIPHVMEEVPMIGLKMTSNTATITMSTIVM